MAISFTRYVDIVSGVGAAAAVQQRELIGRLFTINPLLPPDSFVEMDNIEDVGSYFGTSSVEYLRAQFYFGWISKEITTPPKISFARWVEADQAAVIYGHSATYNVGQFTSITTGALLLTVGDAPTHTLTGINLSAAGSLAVVASDIQTAIHAYTAGGLDWTASTVSYDATRKSFNFVGGVAGDEVLVVGTAGVGVDLAPLLGWTTGAIVGQGADAESITDALANSAAASNNFGSFLFMPTLTTDEITEAATWNNTQNILYQYMVPVTVANAAAVSGAIIDLAGCAMTLSPLSSEYPEQVPMMILAATNYDNRSSVQNYMFQIFALTASVTNNTDANTYDALRVNYYGVTQTAGQYIKFYQRGLLTGLPVSPIDQNTYGNEQWLKDALGAAIMTLLLAVSRVSANLTGRSQVLAIMQPEIDLGIFNGSISVGKPLVAVQKLYITNATGDNTAWHQVQNQGYWVDCVIQTFVEDSVTRYKAVYTLIYSKDDVIRKVEGRDILI